MVPPTVRARRPVLTRWIRQPSLLLLALGLSYGLFVASLGLRWSIVSLGALPPLAGLAALQRRDARRRRTDEALANPGGAGSLMDPAELARRLDPITPRKPSLAGGAAGGELPAPRQRACQQLEEIRQLAVRCAQLDPLSTVDLLVLLEELVDRIQHQATPLEGPLLAVRERLASAHQDGLQQASKTPGLPVRLSLLPSSLLP
jgi:hypothetical protein